MGLTTSMMDTDFHWKYDDEPHASRRKEIMAKYPQVKELFGPEPYMRYLVPLIVLFQLVTSYYICQLPGPIMFLFGYVLTGTLNHTLSLAMHEIAHNMAFGHSRPMANRIMGFISNIPLCTPSSITFKKYHLDHHRYQGDNLMDVDIPTHLEGYLFFNALTKIIWVILQPFFYAIRPLFMNPKPMENLEMANYLFILGTNCLIYNYLGGWVLFYMFASSVMAMGLHPMAGHFISEHYCFIKGQETYSYYGPLNILAWNVGYHNEHHDFPYVPWSRLPAVKALAPEYYEMPSYDSWSGVVYKYIMDPTIGPYSRVKRNIKGAPGNDAATGKPVVANGDIKKVD